MAIIDLDNEVWKKLDTYQSKFCTYYVSNMGRVKSVYVGPAKKREQLLTPCANKIGYLMVSLVKDGKSSVASVHRLVAEHFVDGYTQELEVDHINDNKTDNRAENLEWISHKENLNKRRFSPTGYNSKKIRCVETGKIFDSIKIAAEHLGVTRDSLQKHLSGITKSCSKLHFEYI